jgi:hypothetical protein
MATARADYGRKLAWPAPVIAIRGMSCDTRPVTDRVCWDRSEAVADLI